MTFDGNDDMTAAHEALWDAVEDGDAARLAALFGAVPGLRDVVDDIHPRSPFVQDPLEPVFQMDHPLSHTDPLHHATHLGYEDVCAVLLENGATLNRRCDDETPLTCAARNGKLGAALLLLDRGADPDGRLRELPPAFEDFDPKSLLEDGGPPLLRDGREYDGGEPSALGPLHYAAQRGDEQMVGLLLERGATCDLPDFNGNTALHHAGRVDSAEVTRRLMAAGANELLKNKGGETPLEAAGGHERDLYSLEMDGSAAAKVIVDHVARMEEVASDGDYRPWEMNAPEPSWAGEFWGALRAKDTPVAQRMLQENPRLARARHPNGTTALHLAVYDTDLTQEMIARGADVDARDGFGDTALHHAARLSADGAIWHLRRAGIRAYEDNRAGLCPYDISRYTWGGQRHSLLLTDIGDKIDYSALTDVRSSGIMCDGCSGAPMLIVPVEGKEMLVCDNPGCGHTTFLTDVMGAGDATEAGVVTAGK